MASDWSSGIDLFLDLDWSGGLRNGIEHALREAICGGRLTRGAILPSSRSLARDLGVARGTVSAAYDQLAAEGYLDVRQGTPARVRWLQRHRPPAADSPEPAAHPRWDFRPGRPESASFPRHAWARAHRQVMSHAPDEVFGYGDVRGSVELRDALTDYLGRARGVDTDPARLLVCNGFTQALTLICCTLRTAGATTLAVEDPGARRYRQLAEAAGLSVVAVPCDQDGLRIDLLPRSGASAVLVTPAHQYPLGVTMSPARRIALVEWARRHQALIIEDDYDGEFRYDRQPVGALQQLDPECVIYAGSASKTLAPGLRLGWISSPTSLGKALRTAKQHLDRGSSILEQLTFAELIASGAFDQHVRRMRASYRRRRDDLRHALAANRPDLHLAGISAGLHALIYLPERGPSEHQIRTRAAGRSIGLHTLASYWHSPPEPCPKAIIIGYATPASHAYQPALGALTRLLALN
ncbi:MAG TPA: PLP-dependent aminotransferase family protein [Streptosporangiaceae bacterium]|nr:PLP-dependent aminotransferase family protein [Streptosporangiaceae bacterium]